MNGTFVNGERLSPAEEESAPYLLKTGDIIVRANSLGFLESLGPLLALLNPRLVFRLSAFLSMSVCSLFPEHVS